MHMLTVFAGTFKGELTSEPAINEYCIGRLFDEYMANKHVIPVVPLQDMEPLRKEV